MMISHYLVTAIRHAERHKLYTFINVFGVAVGLAACMILLLIVQYQLSFDRWLPGADRVYQVQSEFVSEESPSPRSAMGPWPAADALARDFPQVESATATMKARPVFLNAGAATFIEKAIVADPQFFQVLELPFVAGDPATALASPTNIVLTEKEARRLFGTADVMGRTMTFVRGDATVDRRVSGILRDIPDNSHLRIDAVLAFDPAPYADNPDLLPDWGDAVGWTYVKLRRGAHIADIQAALEQFVTRHTPPTAETGWKLKLHLAPAREIYLRHSEIAGMRPGGDYRSVQILSLVALIILAIATINFTNLATARAGRRAREIGVRKVVGARRSQLAAQFLGESVLMALSGLAAGLAIAELALPYVARMMEAPLELRYFGEGGVFLSLFGLALFVGLLGGLYPAVQLSAIRPAGVLKSAHVGDPPGSGRLRGVLVISQFAAAIGLVACTLIIFSQSRHAQTLDPGYEREGLLVVNNFRGPVIQPVAAGMIAQMEELSGVLGVARTSIRPAQDGESNMPVKVPGRSELVPVGDYVVDSEFFRTLGIRTLAGRTFSPRFPADDATYDSDPESPAPSAESVTARGVNIVISEDAVPALGFDGATGAIGKRIGLKLEGGLPFTQATIVGVVNRVQYRSARDQVKPVVYTMNPRRADALVLRYRSPDPARLDRAVGKIWQRNVATIPYESKFVDESIAELYRSETARGRGLAAFSALAIMIAALGLFGLATFTAERRTREIGIRKVFGARTGDIVRLLVWQFTRPVVIANLIAWPVAWWVMRDWLNGFSARIDLGPEPFVLAGLIAFAIAVGTVAGHALRIARKNPIHALRYE